MLIANNFPDLDIKLLYVEAGVGFYGSYYLEDHLLCLDFGHIDDEDYMLPDEYHEL